MVDLAHAKINLGLQVGTRRPDGFHDIVTTMALLELADRLRIDRTCSGIRFSCPGRGFPSGSANLAYRAAECFFAASRLSGGCRIRLHKRIPPGAGLGGGSSDAAAVLCGLNRLYGNPLSRRRLSAVAATLGSDVPFFLRRAACVARGRGERLRSVRLPRLHVILHCPGYGVPTARAYRELDGRRARRPGLTSFRLSPKILGLSLRQGELGRVAAQVRNSFESLVFQQHPELARVRELLLEHGAYAAALSGSGSTVYGLVEMHGWYDPMAALKRHGYHCIRTRTI